MHMHMHIMFMCMCKSHVHMSHVHVHVHAHAHVHVCRLRGVPRLDLLDEPRLKAEGAHATLELLTHLVRLRVRLRLLRLRLRRRRRRRRRHAVLKLRAHRLLIVYSALRRTASLYSTLLYTY